MNSLNWKRVIGKYYRIFRPSIKNRKIILIYHAVGNGPWAISTTLFKQQIQWLKAHCKIVSLNELLSIAPKKNIIEVSLTFDDGYGCLYDHVVPILQAENVSATVYINTGRISEDNTTRNLSNPDAGHYPGESFLTWGEVIKLQQLGWEIGSHGVEHLDLTQQNSETIKNELISSKLKIESTLQKKCVHFAYTFGKYSSAIKNAVAHVGYQFAVTGNHAALKNDHDSLALPRLNIAMHYTMSDFENIILGNWDFLGMIHKIKRLV